MKKRFAFPMLAALAVMAAAAAFAVGAQPLTDGAFSLSSMGALDPHALSLIPLGIGATKSKFFRVATEGATTDGRDITRAWIDQMARNFDQKKYGARVWLEHYRGITPDSVFKAYGDVTAVEARDVEDGKRGLFAQIVPLPELVAMNKAKQKIYTSIEVDPKFAGSGEAYMVGLAVTDSPASLGTEVLSFASQNKEASPFAGRKAGPDNLFTSAVETVLDFEEEEDKDAGKYASKLMGFVTGMFSKKHASDESKFTAVAEGMEAMANAVAEKAKATDDSFAALSAAHDKTLKTVTELSAQLAALTKQNDTTPNQSYRQRPSATGGDGSVLTDF